MSPAIVETPIKPDDETVDTRIRLIKHRSQSVQELAADSELHELVELFSLSALAVDEQTFSALKAYFKQSALEDTIAEAALYGMPSVFEVMRVEEEMHRYSESLAGTLTRSDLVGSLQHRLDTLWSLSNAKIANEAELKEQVEIPKILKHLQK